MNTYVVIFVDPDDHTGWVAYVSASTPGHAQDQCNDAVYSGGGIWDGCNFTIWPEPVNA